LRTAPAIHLAAWLQRPQGLRSRMHCATDTGSAGHGARSSLTSATHSRRSRGVIALVSTPGKTTSFGSGSACPVAPPLAAELLALESRQPVATTPMRLTSARKPFRKAQVH